MALFLQGPRAKPTVTDSFEHELVYEAEEGQMDGVAVGVCVAEVSARNTLASHLLFGF